MDKEGVRAARNQLDLTQAEFGAVLGVSRGTVAKVEAGTKPVSAKLAAKIGEALGGEAPAGSPIASPPPRPKAQAPKSAALSFSDPDAAAVWDSVFMFPPEPGAADAVRDMVASGETWRGAFERLLTLGALHYWKAQKEAARAQAVKVADPDRIAKARAAMEGKA